MIKIYTSQLIPDHVKNLFLVIWPRGRMMMFQHSGETYITDVFAATGHDHSAVVFAPNFDLHKPHFHPALLLSNYFTNAFYDDSFHKRCIISYIKTPYVRDATRCTMANKLLFVYDSWRVVIRRQTQDYDLFSPVSLWGITPQLKKKHMLLLKDKSTQLAIDLRYFDFRRVVNILQQFQDLYAHEGVDAHVFVKLYFALLRSLNQGRGILALV